MTGPVESEASPDPPEADTSPVGVEASPDANTIDVTDLGDTYTEPGATGILLQEHQTHVDEDVERNIFGGELSYLGKQHEQDKDTAQTTVDAGVEGAQQTAEGVVNEARNVGPDYLDELTGLAIGLAVFIGGLWLLRPLLTIGANVTG